MQHARPNRLRRAVVYAALATLLGVVSLTLSQCTLVGDNLTGVELNRGRPTTCIKQCNDFYKLVYDQEQKYHDQILLQCHALIGPAQNDCLVEEAARHEAEMARISQAKKDCQDGCHRQGTGSAG